MADFNTLKQDIATFDCFYNFSDDNRIWQLWYKRSLEVVERLKQIWPSLTEEEK